MIEHSLVSCLVEICLCHLRREVGVFWHRFPMLSWLQLLYVPPFFDALLKVHVDGGLRLCNLRISPILKIRRRLWLFVGNCQLVGPWRLRTPKSRYGKQRGRARGSLTPPWRLPRQNIKAILSAQGIAYQQQEQPV